MQKFELSPTRMDARKSPTRQTSVYECLWLQHLFISCFLRRTCWIDGRKELGPTVTSSTCLSLQAHLLSRDDLQGKLLLGLFSIQSHFLFILAQLAFLASCFSSLGCVVLLIDGKNRPTVNTILKSSQNSEKVHNFLNKS